MSAKLTNRERAYRADRRDYDPWCANENIPTNSPVSLARYIDHLAKRGFSYSTIERRVHGISSTFLDEAPGDEKPLRLSRTAEVRAALFALREKVSIERQRQAALTRNGLRALLVAIDETTTRGLRDHALLTLAYGAMLKSGQLADLKRKDVTLLGDRIEVHLPKRGRKTLAPTDSRIFRSVDRDPDELLDAVNALKAWIECANMPADSALWLHVTKGDTILKHGISTSAIDDVIKTRTEGAGLPSEGVSGESPRIGGIVELAAQGLNEDEIAARTGHTVKFHLRPLLQEVQQRGPAAVQEALF